MFHVVSISGYISVSLLLVLELSRFCPSHCAWNLSELQTGFATKIFYLSLEETDSSITLYRDKWCDRKYNKFFL